MDFVTWVVSRFDALKAEAEKERDRAIASQKLGPERANGNGHRDSAGSAPPKSAA